VCVCVLVCGCFVGGFCCLVWVFRLGGGCGLGVYFGGGGLFVRVVVGVFFFWLLLFFWEVWLCLVLLGPVFVLCCVFGCLSRCVFVLVFG